MKKLLITLLVFCIASSAHAVQLSLTADADTPTAYISGLLDQDIYVIFDSYEGITVELGPDAPDLSGPSPPIIVPFPSPYPFPWEEYWILASSTLTVYPIVDGTYLLINGVVGDSVVAAWFDEMGNGDAMGPVTLVPEPTTIALLGLGGIFLIRRTKHR
ncbi:MAG: PEP-CTERM sorting domain-containing protein [Planctomycetota bacterium]|jgi:hypothetical protein